MQLHGGEVCPEDRRAYRLSVPGLPDEGVEEETDIRILDLGGCNKEKDMSEIVKSVVVHLCDFCPGWTVEEETDPSQFRQLIIAEQEYYAMRITLPNGGTVGFCEKCLADALTHSLIQYRGFHSLEPLPCDFMETNKDDHLG